jgi:hypothetical protein
MGRRRKQLQNVLQEMTACCTLKEEALDRTRDELDFGRGTLRNEERNRKWWFKMRQKRKSNT